MFYPKYSRRAAPNINKIQNLQTYSFSAISTSAPICPTKEIAAKKTMQ